MKKAARWGSRSGGRAPPRLSAGSVLRCRGSSCEHCREADPERAAILEFNADGSGRRVFARGLRNAVGVGIHPLTNEIWVTNNGLDKMGTMLPPEGVRIVRDGSFHGWPIAYGYGVWIDYDNFYRDERLAHTARDSADIASMYPPVGLMPAHTAPMAIHFYTGEMLGPRFKNAALVALRAGRLAPVGGHKVMALFSEPDGSNPRVADFVTGFQPDEFDGYSVWGEPAGIAEDERGHIYISSDWTSHLIVKLAPNSLKGTWDPRIPDHALIDGRIALEATVRVDERDPQGDAVIATADLSEFGGDQRHPLHDEGDGTFSLDTTLPTGPEVGTRSIRVLLEQQTSAGLDVLSFSHAIHVVRGEDLVVADDGLADDWTVLERGGVALQPVGDDGALLIGVDLKKDLNRLHRAYNDAAGHTADFNLNLLHRMRAELGAEVDPDGFQHRAFFNEDESRIEMHLTARGAQTIRLGDTEFAFADGETIHTENSYKYGIAGFHTLAARAGFAAVQSWTDGEILFSVHFLASAPAAPGRRNYGPSRLVPT